MYAIYLVWGSFSVAILACLVTSLIPSFSSLLSYGKYSPSSSSSSSFLWKILTITVRKERFKDFYSIGTVWMTVILLEIFLWKKVYHTPLFITKWILELNNMDGKPLEYPQEEEWIEKKNSQFVLFFFLFLLHVGRRSFECFFIMKFSDATMQALHYVIGVAYYFATSLSLIVEAPFFNSHPDSGLGAIELDTTQKGGVILFFIAAYLQFRSHSELASLRSDSKHPPKGDKSSKKNSYSIPQGLLFEYVSSPHFFAEILLYFSLMIMTKFEVISLYFVMVWVVMNLGITSYRTHQWYLSKFKNYPKKRTALIPFIF